MRRTWQPPGRSAGTVPPFSFAATSPQPLPPPEITHSVDRAVSPGWHSTQVRSLAVRMRTASTGGAAAGGTGAGVGRTVGWGGGAGVGAGAGFVGGILATGCGGVFGSFGSGEGGSGFGDSGAGWALGSGAGGVAGTAGAGRGAGGAGGGAAALAGAGPGVPRESLTRIRLVPPPGTRNWVTSTISGRPPWRTLSSAM